MICKPQAKRQHLHHPQPPTLQNKTHLVSDPQKCHRLVVIRAPGRRGAQRAGPPRTQCYKKGLVVGGLEANGLDEDPVMKGLVEIPAGWLRGLCPSLAGPRSPKEEPSGCCGPEGWAGKSAGGKGLEKAPAAGGTVWGKPGPALLIPKPGPVAKPLGWNGLVEGSWG